MIQELKIETEEILHLVREMTERHEMQSDDWHTPLAILFERYPGDADRTFCISERMRCLLEMMKDARMRGWSFRSPDQDGVVTNVSVFRATARCPLRIDGEHLGFNADEFFQIVLEDSEPAANA